ncbi:MAG: DUF2510 domain-containing protein, partial [Propionibacteriaceae bacterium]|nr:DUF2510 domain-containing protein [Propionibacteriaceae bacterium]
TSTPTPSPSASNSGGSLVACPDTLATGNTPQIAGKLTADTLQVNQINGWGSEDMALNFTYDGHWQNKVIAQSFLSVWESNIGVALLSNADGFTDPQTSAEQIMECFASSGYYINFTGRTNQVNQAMTVAGHPAWRIESQIHVNDPDFPQVQGDVADVIVVNLGGSKDHLGLFLSCYTIGDAATQQQVLNAMSTLTVTG